MIVVPGLRSNKHVGPLDLPRLEHLLHRVADLFFIPITFRGVELSKSCFQRRLGRGLSRDGVGNQCPETERGDRTRSDIERYLRIAKVIGFYHCFDLPRRFSWTSARTISRDATPRDRPRQANAGKFSDRSNVHFAMCRNRRSLTGLKYCGGPNGIRTRVPTLPHAFASESESYGVLSQRASGGDGILTGVVG